MYICDDCGALFHFPTEIHEVHNELEDTPEETWYVCPHCNSTEYSEAVQCDLCGEYVAHDYVELVNGTIACSDCYTKH